MTLNCTPLGIVNKKIKRINLRLSIHSFRHRIIRVNRDLVVDTDAIEVYTGHRLAGMKAAYGDGYSVERLRKVAARCWEQIQAWLFN